MFFFKGFASFFLIVLIFDCSTIFGQSKNLDIKTSHEIEKLLSLKILVNKNKYENNYYAIQLYNGNYEKAKKILSEFKKKFPCFYIDSMIKKSEKIVFAWGNCKERPLWIENLVKNPLCFGYNKNGSPKHPLYLPKGTSLVKFF